MKGILKRDLLKVKLCSLKSDSNVEAVIKCDEKNVKFDVPVEIDGTLNTDENGSHTLTVNAVKEMTEKK